MSDSWTKSAPGARWLTLLAVAVLGTSGCGADPVETLAAPGTPSGAVAQPGATVPGGMNANGGVPGAPAAPGTPMGGGAEAATPGAQPTAGAGAGAAGAGAGAPGAGSTTAVTPPPPPPPDGARPGLAARLSKLEYEFSVQDVLGVQLLPDELDAAAGGIPDDGGDGVFKHFADKQTSEEQHPLAYFEVGKAVAGRVDVNALAAEHGACTDAVTECGQAFVASVGRRLFRRALDERELAVFAGVFDTVLTEGNDFDVAARASLHALLQAPQFLFRMVNETEGVSGEDRALSGTELAARLASFLWVSVPDEQLLQAAESGALLDPTGLDAEVTRMLADPKAERFTEVIATDFSRARFASFEGVDEPMRAALQESVVATFQHHFWEAQRSVADLFTTTDYMLNAQVAELIGAPFAGAGMQLVDVSTMPERVGVLVHPGMIAGMGDREIGSFVNRGKYLMERLLCRNPISLPAGLEQVLEEFEADTAGLNEHQRVEIRMMRPDCWGCHAQFEPLAFGLSRFDAAGRYIGETDETGFSLSLDGWVPVTTEADSPRYTDVASYMSILATDETVQNCMTEHFLNFATAHGTDSFARNHAQTVGQAYRSGGSTLSAMVKAVAQDRLFNHIHVVAAEATAGGN